MPGGQFRIGGAARCPASAARPRRPLPRHLRPAPRRARAHSRARPATRRSPRRRRARRAGQRVMLRSRPPNGRRAPPQLALRGVARARRQRARPSSAATRRASASVSAPRAAAASALGLARARQPVRCLAERRALLARAAALLLGPRQLRPGGLERGLRYASFGRIAAWRASIRRAPASASREPASAGAHSVAMRADRASQRQAPLDRGALLSSAAPPLGIALAALPRARYPRPRRVGRSSSASRRAAVSRRARAAANWCASSWPRSRSRVEPCARFSASAALAAPAPPGLAIACWIARFLGAARPPPSPLRPPPRLRASARTAPRFDAADLLGQLAVALGRARLAAQRARAVLIAKDFAEPGRLASAARSFCSASLRRA